MSNVCPNRPVRCQRLSSDPPNQERPIPLLERTINILLVLQISFVSLETTRWTISVSTEQPIFLLVFRGALSF